MLEVFTIRFQRKSHWKFLNKEISNTSIVLHHSKITTSLKTDFIKILVCYLGTDKTVIYKNILTTSLVLQNIIKFYNPLKPKKNSNSNLKKTSKWNL